MNNDNWSFKFGEDCVIIDFSNDRVIVNGLILTYRSGYFGRLIKVQRAIYMVIGVLEQYGSIVNSETTNLLLRTFDELIERIKKEGVKDYSEKLADKLTDLLQDMGYNCEVY